MSFSGSFYFPHFSFPLNRPLPQVQVVANVTPISASLSKFGPWCLAVLSQGNIRRHTGNLKCYAPGLCEMNTRGGAGSEHEQ